MAENSIHENHRGRMLDKLQKNGLAVFSDHEVLEILLYFSIPRMDTNEIAHTLINRFGSLHAVFEATEEELVQIKGIGTRSAVLIHFMHELFCRYQKDCTREEFSMTRLNTIDRMGAYFVPQFMGVTHEVLLAAYVDNKGKILGCEVISEGTSSMVQVNTRKIIEEAFARKAAGIVLAHNHPGGDAVPSKEDIGTTKNLENVLGSIGLQLVDHIVVAGGQFMSINSLRKPYGKKEMF